MTKKAIQVMLTTSLAITPVLAYTPSADAATYSDNVTRLKVIYNNLSTDGITVYNAAAADLNKLSPAQWEAVIGANVKTKIDTATSSGKAVEIAKALATILYSSNGNTLETNITAFKNTYSADFDKVFGTTVTVDKLVAYFTEAEKAAWDVALADIGSGSSNWTGFLTGDQAAYKTFIRKVRDKVETNNPSLASLDSQIKAGIGVGLDDLFMMKDRLNSELTLTATQKSTLKSALMLAVFASGDPAPAPASGGGGAVPPTTGDTTTPQEGQVIVDNGVAKVTKEVTADGKTTVHVQLSVDNVTKAIGNKGFEKLTIQTKKGAQGEVTQVELPAEAFAVVSSKNKNAVVEFATDGAAYQLPAKEIDTKALAASLGTTTDDVTIEVAVNEIAKADVQENVAKNNLTLASKVFEFTITASSKNGNQTEIKKFTQYVERNIQGEQNFDAIHATAVILNEDGSITPVPTRFTGKSAAILSRSNSKYTVVENNVTFSDITDKWYEANVEKLASKYIINGTAENQYSPNSTTTRAQLTALLVRSLGLSANVNYDGKFNDVNGNEWFAKELKVAVDAGMIDGFEDGTFRPNEVVTREQAAAMIHRAMAFTTFDQTKLDHSKDASMKYKDYASVSTWATSDVETMTEAGIMQGNADGTFDPKDGTSRGEMAAVIDRFLMFVNFIN